MYIFPISTIIDLNARACRVSCSIGVTPHSLTSFPLGGPQHQARGKGVSYVEGSRRSGKPQVAGLLSHPRGEPLHVGTGRGRKCTPHVPLRHGQQDQRRGLGGVHPPRQQHNGHRTPILEDIEKIKQPNKMEAKKKHQHFFTVIAIFSRVRNMFFYCSFNFQKIWE